MASWSARDSSELYNVARWGGGYFRIADDGSVEVLDRNSGAHVSFQTLSQRCREAGLQLPVLMRFPHILHDRVRTLVDAFHQGIDYEGYRGHFTPIYPIKVNQQFRVVKELVAGQKAVLDGRMGLEAGSKPELLAVLAIAEPGRSTIVCNGYKDRDYIRLALIGQRLGHQVYIVLEKSSEVDDVLTLARELGVSPRIGVRARLSSISKGNWQDTGGPKSKFGLSASEILNTVDRLRRADALEAFQLLHFHLGSQIANIQDIQIGLREAARFYSELSLLGVPLKVVDVGGGLGVDYEGTASRSACSVNYSLNEYASRVIHAFRDAADRHDLPHPDVFTESGRAMTAHHAVLMTNIIGMETQDAETVSPPGEGTGALAQDIWRNYEDAVERRRSLFEVYHDLAAYTQENNQAFALGQVGLGERAQNEQVLKATARHLLTALNPGKKPHRVILDELNEQMADKLFANFSLFQSLPDVWGVDQIFPILPLQNLDREPDRRVVLRDITCDSDGRIDHYVDGEGIEATLPYPSQPADNALLGFFLVGAYQEILGDLHNLFGDTDAADIRFDPDSGEPIVSHAQRGDTVRQVLRFVNFDPDVLLQSLSDQVSESGLDRLEKDELLSWLADGMSDTTYLD